MAPGDASRTCFSEMVETLRQEWKPEMAWKQVIDLRNCLDSMLNEIRFGRGIRPPMWCPVCNRHTQQAAPSVSIRALILALGRLALSVPWKRNRWRSAGKNTVRKTALIGMVSQI